MGFEVVDEPLVRGFVDFHFGPGEGHFGGGPCPIDRISQQIEQSQTWESRMAFPDRLDGKDGIDWADLSAQISLKCPARKKRAIPADALRYFFVPEVNLFARWKRDVRVKAHLFIEPGCAGFLGADA